MNTDDRPPKPPVRKIALDLPRTLTPRQRFKLILAKIDQRVAQERAVPTDAQDPDEEILFDAMREIAKCITRLQRLLPARSLNTHYRIERSIETLERVGAVLALRRDRVIDVRERYHRMRARWVDDDDDGDDEC